MQKLTDWKARQTGGAITVDATDPDFGAPIKVRNIVSIQPERRGLFRRHRIVATVRDGSQYELA